MLLFHQLLVLSTSYSGFPNMPQEKNVWGLNKLDASPSIK